MDTQLQGKDKATLFLRLLLNKHFTAKVDILNKILPKDELEQLQAVTSHAKEPSLVLSNPRFWLQICDPSWYEATLASFSKPLQDLYSQIMPPHTEPFSLSPAVCEFLFQYLHSQWQKQAGDTLPLPKELIEAGDLGPLLELKKQDLLEIADLLSMHNLVDEVRQVVDKKILQVLSQVLTTNQQQYLRMCLRQKTKHHAPTFSLRDLLKEPKKLPGVLHKQGLRRLATALSGQDQNFIWYVLHTLDIARAKFVQADIQKEAVPHATKLAQLEILQIVQFLKTGKAS